MHCRVLVAGFSRDMSGSRDAVASCEAVWPTLCSPVSHKEKQSTATAPVGQCRLLLQGILASVSTASKAEVSVSEIRLWLRLIYPIGNTSKSTILRNTHSCPHHKSLGGLLIMNQQVHPRTRVRTALCQLQLVRDHFWQQKSSHPCLKDTLKQSISVTSEKVLVVGWGEQQNFHTGFLKHGISFKAVALMRTPQEV